MPEITLENLVSRLDLLQHNIWKIEERAMRIIAMLSKNQADMEELKASQEVLGEKCDKIETEVRGLRGQNGKR